MLRGINFRVLLNRGKEYYCSDFIFTARLDSGGVARWRGGAVARWRSGAVALWRGGAVVQ